MNIWMLLFPYWKIIKEDWKYLSVTQWDLSYGVLNLFFLITLLSIYLWQYDVSLITFVFWFLFILSKYKGTSFLWGADIPFMISLLFLWVLYWNIQSILMILSFTIIPYVLMYYFTRTRSISKNSNQILQYIDKTGEIDSLLDNWVDLTTYKFKEIYSIETDEKSILKGWYHKDESYVLFKKLLRRISFLPYLVFLNLTILIWTILSIFNF